MLCYSIPYNSVLPRKGIYFPINLNYLPSELHSPNSLTIKEYYSHALINHRQALDAGSEKANFAKCKHGCSRKDKRRGDAVVHASLAARICSVNRNANLAAGARGPPQWKSNPHFKRSTSAHRAEASQIFFQESPAELIWIDPIAGALVYSATRASEGRESKLYDCWLQPFSAQM